MGFINAGHHLPMMIHAGSIFKIPDQKGIALGVRSNATNANGQITPAPGDSMLFFSDSVIEAENETKILFGYDRMVGCIDDTQFPPGAIRY